MYMLPEFFAWEQSEVLGPRLMKWWNFMSKEVQVAMIVRDEIENALGGWRNNKRWDPILEELRLLKSQ